MLNDFVTRLMKVQEVSLKLHRRQDQDTSIEAAIRIAGQLNTLQNKVYDYATRMKEGFTDHDLNEYFGSTYSTWRSRRAELTAKGIIVNSGRKYKINNTNRIVWILKEYA